MGANLVWRGAGQRRSNEICMSRINSANGEGEIIKDRRREIHKTPREKPTRCFR